LTLYDLITIFFFFCFMPGPGIVEGPSQICAARRSILTPSALW
jgi:hypothetical protein